MKIAVLLLTISAVLAAAAPARELNFGAPPPDVDECLVDNGGCSHCCTNYDYLVFEMSFECTCPEGWSMTEDSMTCSQDLACPAYGCSHICEETAGVIECVPAPEPVCSCPGCAAGMGDGHVLSDDGMTCVDVDECAVDNGGCSDICVNTPGCYECACPPGCDDPELPIPAGGYTLDGLTCTDVDECSAAGWEGACAGICENEPGCYACISADVTTDYKMSLTLIMHEYLVDYMNEAVFAQMVADTIGIEPQYIQIDNVAQVGEDTEVSFTWFALDATTFVTLLLAVEQIDWVPVLIQYMTETLPAGAF